MPLIAFGAVGFTRTFCAEPITTDKQHLSLRERNRLTGHEAGAACRDHRACTSRSSRDGPRRHRTGFPHGGVALPSGPRARRPGALARPQRVDRSVRTACSTRAPYWGSASRKCPMLRLITSSRLTRDRLAAMLATSRAFSGSVISR